MTFKLFVPLFLFFVTPFLLLAQDNIDQVTTDIEQQVINTYEGFPPLPFEAPDTDGNKHALAKYKGRVVILYFWSVEKEESYMQIPLLERLQAEYPTDKAIILTMAKEDEASVDYFKNLYPFNLPIIPNTDELGTMGFAGELGDPRVFVIDTFGVINELFIGKHMKGPTDLYQLLKPHVVAMLK